MKLKLPKILVLVGSLLLAPMFGNCGGGGIACPCTPDACEWFEGKLIRCVSMTHKSTQTGGIQEPTDGGVKDK
jgi:hypothetical protein